MIIVMGQIRLGDGEGERARALLTRHMADVAAEEGCELYCFAYDATDPDLVRVAERWTSWEALAAHGQAPHQKAFGRALQAHGVREIGVDAYEGAFARKLI